MYDKIHYKLKKKKKVLETREQNYPILPEEEIQMIIH